MARFLIALLAVSFLIQSDVSIRQAVGCTSRSGETDCKPCLRPGSEPGKETHNKAPDVTDLTLEKAELHIPPKTETEPTPGKGHSRELTVGVTTSAADPEGDVLTYNYTVSGGRIVGTGARVAWDLNGVLPGTYSITAGVDDGCGICGKTMTQTVNVIQD